MFGYDGGLCRLYYRCYDHLAIMPMRCPYSGLGAKPDYGALLFRLCSLAMNAMVTGYGCYASWLRGLLIIAIKTAIGAGPCCYCITTRGGINAYGVWP